MARPTSHRLTPDLRDRIGDEAARRGLTATSLVSSLLDEGLKTRRFAGIVYRDGPTGRRAAIAGGPDVWEVVRAVRAAPGRGHARVRAVARDTGLGEWMVQLAVAFAAEHPDEIEERLRLDDEAAEHLTRQIRTREQLIGA